MFECLQVKTFETAERDDGSIREVSAVYLTVSWRLRLRALDRCTIHSRHTHRLLTLYMLNYIYTGLYYFFIFLFNQLRL